MLVSHRCGLQDQAANSSWEEAEAHHLGYWSNHSRSWAGEVQDSNQLLLQKCTRNYSSLRCDQERNIHKLV
ncbi:hypothetical protein LINPERPRIM_LOCUS27186 [Linum perenne]